MSNYVVVLVECLNDALNSSFDIIVESILAIIHCLLTYMYLRICRDIGVMMFKRFESFQPFPIALAWLFCLECTFISTEHAAFIID